MKVVAAVVGGEELIGMLRISDDGVEVNDRVEVAGGAYPFIDGLAVGFAEGAGVVVGGADVRCDGGSVNAKAVSVAARNDLLVSSDDALDESGVFGRWNFAVAGEAAKVVYAFEDDEPADTGGSKYIAIEAGQSAGTEAVDEEVVATNALVGDADVVSGG